MKLLITTPQGTEEVQGDWNELVAHAIEDLSNYTLSLKELRSLIYRLARPDEWRGKDVYTPGGRTLLVRYEIETEVL